MKRKRFKLQITERQQLVIGSVLVILVAISMLYCLGFASVALRQAWESGPLQWDQEDFYPEENLDLTAIPLVEPADSGTAPP